MKVMFSFVPDLGFSIIIMGVIGALIGCYFFLNVMKVSGDELKTVVIGIFISILAGLIGSRIIYVIANKLLQYFYHSSEGFYFKDGGFSLYGGLATGLVVGYLYLKKKGIAPWQTLDRLAPFLILALGISRIGSEVYGLPIARDALWTLKIEGNTYHPTQAYEFLLCYILFGYLWLRLKSKAYHGQVILQSIVGLFLIKGIVQISLDVPLVFGPITLVQLVSFIGIIITTIYMKFHKQNSVPLKQENVEKYDISKTWLYIWVLMFLSLISYYLIQG
ncbi:prolipoprotein diacylglyceryl transferase [Anaerobacillus isosaccharinicus]|uniref:Prolipoprotein diacylglyceryl transferase n=1 Tax=Anaerobacillus isosaccharinicus TaxID=1532552 RepID=A0A1S2LIS3_9BACI|nr:prolipoprotein diacylglyceryl transferase family protein [Anaerobacillus isosaccharinicus]QOY35631.1 prolipoprotein diacylglyceryl transferase [Anaerobacillus isosaccharinicus]